MFNKPYALAIVLALLCSAGVSAQDYSYNPQRSAVLLVDPYNEFLSEGGLLYPISKQTLEANNAIANMKALVDAARASGMKVIYVPHHHYNEGDYSDWKFSGFANTDLDFLLKIHDIDHVILAGMRANTCVESTARYAVELGYHTTMLTDAIGAFNMEEMQAAVEIDYPIIAHNVLSTKEFIDAIE